MISTLIAHRCGPDIYPEQSIASARHALELGADLVEMDVQYTCDGVPVICHDPNVRRIFGVDKLCRDMTLAEFMTLRHTVDCSYPSHSLENIFACGVKPLLLHCKISGEPLKDLVSCIVKHGYEKDCVIGVQSVGDAALIKSLCNEIRILAFMPRAEQMEEFVDTPCEIIRLWEEWVTVESVERIHSSGKKVWIMAGLRTEKGVGYTSEENMRYWMELGVDGILVNDVRWAKNIMK